ncbi:MAG: LysR substrate-binding domain-containing protein [Flavobacteriales bacterium]
MNIQQFQYVLAVAENRHFETAADKCFVTQSTLSTMISKFEDEIGIQIFDRKKKPVEITTEGKLILEQLKVIASTIEQLGELTSEIKGDIKGNLSIAVLPTIAPFLLPLFLQNFAARFPNLHITVREQTTEEIVRQIKSRDLDIGIISIPVQVPDILEYKLYDEPFVFYDATQKGQGPISIRKMNMDNLCLLEEGHCMRTQVMKLCDLHKRSIHSNLNFEYKAGSIDSLLRFVKSNKATTLLPFLATVGMPASENELLSQFADPVPYRTIGAVVHRHFVKKKILDMLQKEIITHVSLHLPVLKVKGKKLNPV